VTLTDEYEFKKFKTQIKKVKDKIYNRKLNENNLEGIKEQIEALEYDIRKVVDQERVERELRLAEMEVQKAQNMLDYRNEIYSRPRREWFMSANMKEHIREEAKEAAERDDMSTTFGAPIKKFKRFKQPRR